MKEKIKELVPYVLIILLVVLIRSFIVTPVRVDGESMMPNFKNGEILLLNKLDKNFNRFDIVVFDYKNERLIKRIVGLPGEKVKISNDKLYINNKLIKQNFVRNTITEDYTLEKTIPKNKYFVMGDNRGNSLDSRMIGLIDKKDIDGKISFSIIPLKKVGVRK